MEQGQVEDQTSRIELRVRSTYEWPSTGEEERQTSIMGGHHHHRSTDPITVPMTTIIAQMATLMILSPALRPVPPAGDSLELTCHLYIPPTLRCLYPQHPEHGPLVAVTDAGGLLSADARRLVTLQLAKMIGELVQSVGTPACSAALSSVSSFVDVALERYGVNRGGGARAEDDESVVASRERQRPREQGKVVRLDGLIVWHNSGLF